MLFQETEGGKASAEISDVLCELYIVRTPSIITVTPIVLPYTIHYITPLRSLDYSARHSSNELQERMQRLKKGGHLQWQMITANAVRTAAVWALGSIISSIEGQRTINMTATQC